MYLYTFGFAYLFKCFPYTLYVGYYNGDVLVVATVAVCIGRVNVGNGVLVVVMFPIKFI